MIPFVGFVSDRINPQSVPTNFEIPYTIGQNLALGDNVGNDNLFLDDLKNFLLLYILMSPHNTLMYIFKTNNRRRVYIL